MFFLEFRVPGMLALRGPHNIELDGPYHAKFGGRHGSLKEANL